MPMSSKAYGRRAAKVFPRVRKGHKFRLLANSIGVCLILYSIVIFRYSFQYLAEQQQHTSDNDLFIPLERASLLLRRKNDEADWILTHWEQHVQELVDLCENPDACPIKHVIAFLESPLNASSACSYGNGTAESERPVKYASPLPLRIQGPERLRKLVSPNQVRSCGNIPALLTNDFVASTGIKKDDANPYCSPVDIDPFLPWIHDIFWKGSKVQFIAQNRRRCKAGDKHSSDLDRLEPQVTLLQSVSIQRLSSNEEARELAPELWQSKEHNDPSNHRTFRYRLAPYEEADVNATRFICRFHTWSKKHQRINLGETLSEYDFNYELNDFRKKANLFPGLFKRNGDDHGKYWTSTLMFSCQIPEGINKTPTQHSTTIPTLYVDVIPIRTPPRLPIGGSEEKDPGYYFHPDWAGPSNVGQFDPIQSWGPRHVLPVIEASGRWENLPVCPLLKDEAERETVADAKDARGSGAKEKRKKKHLLSACTWASASFRTPTANKPMVSDTKSRLKEWIDFHLLVGFDHIYVYDNSAANTNETDLSDVTNLYPNTQVTRIDWPSVVCNNKLPLERSSQYAAENSCRLRYGHLTEWIASFDTDEYLVPMGEHTSLRTVVENAKDANILSFKSSRGKLRFLVSEPAEQRSRRKLENVTYLEAYNCDSVKSPKPSFAKRAKKQLFRPDYVLNHFVHYSTVTQAHLITYKDDPEGWSRFFPKDPTERFVDGLHEATMIHAKTASLPDTRNYRNRCNVGFEQRWRGCFVGYPWPNNQEVPGLNQTDGTEYNCFVNKKVEDYWLPRLKEATMKL